MLLCDVVYDTFTLHEVLLGCLEEVVHDGLFLGVGRMGHCLRYLPIAQVVLLLLIFFELGEMETGLCKGRSLMPTETRSSHLGLFTERPREGLHLTIELDEVSSIRVS